MGASGGGWNVTPKGVPLGPMRVEVAGQSVWLETGGDWVVAPGWEERRLQETHGLYLRSDAHGAELHVRRQGCAGPLTSAGLRQLLSEQRWASPPYDEACTVDEGRVIVAGTFDMADDDRVVREWYVTDGRSLASVAMPGGRAVLRDALPSAERLVATIRFER